MQEPNGTRSPSRSLVGFSLGLVLLGAVAAWPEAALAGNLVSNPHWDSNAVEGDLVDVCDTLEIDDAGLLGGRCNKKDAGTGSVTVVYDDIDLSPDIDSSCLQEGNAFELAVTAAGITLSVTCTPRKPSGEVVRSVRASGKLDDMVGWNTETGQFYGKDEDLKGQ